MGRYVGDYAGDAAGRQHGHVGHYAVFGAFVNHHVVAFAVNGVVHHVGSGVVVQLRAGGLVGVGVGHHTLRSRNRVAADEVVGAVGDSAVRARRFRDAG